MASVVDEIKLSQSTYPWNEWTNGNTFKAVRGVDFDSELTPFGFRQTLYTHARRNDLKVTGKLEDNAVIFQFSKGERSTTPA